jgi:hypothetical protein
MRSRPYDPAQDDMTVGVDWKDPPHEVLEAVDNELAEHGLEVVMLEGGDDQYRFRVERREREGS